MLPGEVGPAGATPPDRIKAALSSVREGRVYSLAATRFPGMPVFPGHPRFEVLSYRTPHGIRVGGDQPWGPLNEAGLGYMSELIMGTAHTGAHIDALAHMTVGADSRWYGGGNEGEHLGDFGPTFGDAEKIPPILARGVLLDVPGWKGVECLDAGEPISGADLAAISDAEGLRVEEFDVVLVRT